MKVVKTDFKIATQWQINTPLRRSALDRDKSALHAIDLHSTVTNLWRTSWSLVNNVRKIPTKTPSTTLAFLLKWQEDVIWWCCSSSRKSTSPLTLPRKHPCTSSPRWCCRIWWWCCWTTMQMANVRTVESMTPLDILELTLGQSYSHRTLGHIEKKRREKVTFFGNF